MHRTTMWQRFTFRGHRVTVIQQWVDPFGRPMVGIGTMVDGDERTDGLQEAAFLREAAPLSPEEAGDDGSTPFA